MHSLGAARLSIAAEKTGRRGYGIEVDPHYVDTIIRRFESIYGATARHAETKLDFEALTISRAKENERGKEKVRKERQLRGRSQ